MKRVREDPIESAHALLAFQRGEDSDDAFLGALLWTEFQALVRGAVGGDGKKVRPKRRGRR